jgi:hypothetical protein
MKTILNPLAILLTACLLVGGCIGPPPPILTPGGGAAPRGDPNRETPRSAAKEVGWGCNGDVSGTCSPLDNLAAARLARSPLSSLTTLYPLVSESFYNTSFKLTYFYPTSLLLLILP